MIFDAQGRVIEKRQFSGTPFVSAHLKATYGDDKAGRLKTVTDPANNTWTPKWRSPTRRSTDRWRQWTFDNIGNRLPQKGKDTVDTSWTPKLLSWLGFKVWDFLITGLRSATGVLKSQFRVPTRTLNKDTEYRQRCH